MRLFSFFFLVVINCASCSTTTDTSVEPDSSDRVNLLAEIESGVVKEQEIRREFINAIETTGFDLELNYKVIEIDSINQILIIRYLDTYGWPKESEVGRNVSRSFFLIIQHADLELMKKYFEEFLDLSRMDEASKIEVAMMQDRILMYEDKKQLFGTQYGVRKNKKGYLTGKYYVWPIENVAAVNQRRDSVGFVRSIEEAAKEMDAEYNKNEELIFD